MPLTWNELCRREPALKALEQEARRLITETIQHAGYDVWYEKIKPKLSELVGDGRPIPGFTPTPPPAPEPGKPIKFESMAELAKRYDKDEPARRAAFAKLTPEMQDLHYSGAYDVAYAHLLEVLEGYETRENN